MKHFSATTTFNQSKTKVEGSEERDADMSDAMILPETKSPDAGLVQRILSYSKSLSVTETASMGKVANVMN